jgi:diacylglycerol kinase (ATP)
MLKSFTDACHGIMLALRTQRNVKIQVLVTISVIIAGIYLSFTTVEWCLVILAIALVIGLEIMNTAIEELVNFVSPEKRKEARRIKDLAAGAVLMAALAATAMAALFLWDKLNQ